MSTTTKNKDWPRACQKEELYSRLNFFSRSEVAAEIYDAILENRQCSQEDAKKVKKLRVNEVKQVLTMFGEL